MSPNGIKLKLLLVGDGRLLPALRELARDLWIDAYCQFPGNLPKLGDVYRGVDIFVMPSLWEGLSLAMLEAMAAGLPMIATDVGGAREVLGDSEWGLLIPPKDPAAIRAAVERLLTDDLLRSGMAQAGKRRVEENYSVTNLAHRLSDLYRSAVEREA
jgi:glycosyltransferase involved in cell wall biosynthesis